MPKSSTPKNRGAREDLSEEETALLSRALGHRPIEKTIAETRYEGLDEFMARGDGERPWQHFELTQREDVVEWVEDPTKILKIQASLRDLTRHLRGLPRPVRILDAGCYGGYLYDYLATHCFDEPADFSYVGVDIDPGSVEAAALLHRDAPNASFQVGDIYALAEQFEPQAFDVVLCSRVLIHIPYLERALRSLFSVTRVMTHVVLEISERPLVQRIVRRNTATGEEHHNYYFRKYSAEELSAAADAVGADYRIIQGPEFYSTFLLLRES